MQPSTAATAGGAATSCSPRSPSCWPSRRHGCSSSRAAVRRRPDVVGALLLGVGLACLLAALVEGRGGATATVAVLLGAAAVLLVGFVVQESRTPEPVIDLALFRSRPFLAATTGALASGLGPTSLAALLATVVQGGLEESLLTASLLVLLFAGSSVVASLRVSRLPANWTSRHLLIGGLLGVAAGQLLQVGLSADSSTLRLLPGTLVVGVCFGVLNATVGREAVASVRPERAAMGSGANNTARYVGSAIGISLVAVVLSGSEPAGTPAGLLSGWSTAARTDRLPVHRRRAHHHRTAASKQLVSPVGAHDARDAAPCFERQRADGGRRPPEAGQNRAQTAASARPFVSGQGDHAFGPVPVDVRQRSPLDLDVARPQERAARDPAHRGR